MKMSIASTNINFKQLNSTYKTDSKFKKKQFKQHFVVKYQHIHLPTVLKLYDFKVCITLPSVEHNRKYNCASTTTDQSNQLVNKTQNTNILPKKATAV